ncbi:hypothetical protein [Pseudobdellovibrio exovorus]|uniref:Uncharacterized protein n=1 Tax=Pseudobdellovibrio exovorus JSS TaxID=1184267 RepID=M4V6A9_9BACT|nr:hypothetical protein [Pseudobdellovibrio exovorus]AGH94907.1 hypothetical protein A11Q_687 [Pseudobdellovibrio exovorus JSS]
MLKKRFLLSLQLFLIFSVTSSVTLANESAELKRSYLEDIFIWKMSDELKLTAKEEKEFTEINKSLNKRKSEINKKIQDSVQALKENASEAELRTHLKLIESYNQIAVDEFNSIKKLLGSKKFVSYLKVKSDLTSRIRTILASERASDTNRKGAGADNPASKLPPPKIIIEKSE